MIDLLGPSPRLRILVSYHYSRTQDVEAWLAKKFTLPYPEIIVDSGAFSAYTQGVAIDVREYGRWLLRWRHLYVASVNLDVIHEPVASQRNLDILEDMGCDPMPVWHAGAPVAVLDALCDRYPYIGIGGMAMTVASGADYVTRAFVEAFKVAGERAVFHGLGMLNWTWLKTFRWYSADSSAWGTGFKFGQFKVFDHRRGTWHPLHLGNAAHGRTLAPLIKRYGYHPIDFADRTRNSSRANAGLGGLSWVAAEHYLRRLHGEIVVPRSPTHVGTKVYLAGSPTEVALLDSELKRRTCP